MIHLNQRRRNWIWGKCETIANVVFLMSDIDFSMAEQMFIRATRMSFYSKGIKSICEVKLWMFIFQACTEMVMPMTVSNESMFPPSTYSIKDFGDECVYKYGVRPRPHWITTEFGGHVSDFYFLISS